MSLALARGEPERSGRLRGEPVDRLRRAQVAEHLGHAQAELLVDHDDLAARDRGSVDEQVDRLAGHPVKRDDRPLSQLQRLADGHPRTAHLDAEVDRHCRQAAQVAERVAGGRELCALVVQLLELHSIAHDRTYWTARSVNRISCTLTSVPLLIAARICFLSFSRPLSLVSVLLLWLVIRLVMMSRTAASSGSVPKPSGGAAPPPSPPAVAPVLCPGASTSATVSVA